MIHRPHVAVVGAGILGASIAWHLARRGARVTVVEAGLPGGTATRRSLAWINASWGNREAYFLLRARAMEMWQTMAAAVPGLTFARTGALRWDVPEDRLTAFVHEHASWGYDLRLVDRKEAARIEPALLAPPEVAVHAPGEGAVEPAVATARLLDAAGAALVPGTMVRAITLRGGRAVGVETATGSIAADSVVIAAGSGTPALAATVGLDLRIDAPPAWLIVARAERAILNGLVLAPALHIRQLPDRRIAASADDDGDDPEQQRERLMATLRSMLRHGEMLVLEEGVLAPRPIPADRMPVVGPVAAVPGLHLAVTHSGVTLAPAIGAMMAETILEGRCDPLIAPFAPDRLWPATAVALRDGR